jgi:hypothetical protein
MYIAYSQVFGKIYNFIDLQLQNRFEFEIKAKMKLILKI